MTIDELLDRLRADELCADALGCRPSQVRKALEAAK
jgi:hypothetical protein